MHPYLEVALYVVPLAAIFGGVIIQELRFTFDFVTRCDAVADAIRG